MRVLIVSCSISPFWMLLRPARTDMTPPSQFFIFTLNETLVRVNKLNPWEEPFPRKMPITPEHSPEDASHAEARIDRNCHCLTLGLP